MLLITGVDGISQPFQRISKNFGSNEGILSNEAAVLANRSYACVGVSPSCKYPPDIVVK
jgi:hypothetical protein